MPRLLQLVVTVLLVAAVALGNCATCLGLSAVTEAGEHACCKPPRDSQPPCHSEKNAPASDQEDCPTGLDALKSEVSQKAEYTPLLAAALLGDPFAGVAGARGSHLLPMQAAAELGRPSQFSTPLRI